jgi:hypothetical protein
MGDSTVQPVQNRLSKAVKRYLLPINTRVVSCNSSNATFSKFWKALFLGIGASLFFSNSASAVETITFKYYSPTSTSPSEVTLSLNEIKQFVQSGELRQQVRDFFNINRQDPGPIQRVMTEQIRVPENFGQNFLNSSAGEFVLIQLQKFIQSSNGATDLRSALRDSIQDDRNISLLEVIEKYPEPQVTVDITSLVKAYGDVSTFVDRILPALEVAKEYLQGIICDCKQSAAPAAPAQANSPQSSIQGNIQSSATQADRCPNTQKTSTTSIPASPSVPTAQMKLSSQSLKPHSP